MATNEEIRAEIRRTFRGGWTKRDGQSVPKPEDLKLQTNDAVELDGTVLYADLAGSSKLVATKKPEFAAEIYKTFLYSVGETIRRYDGQITAYDGDRVMAMFIGTSKNTNAVRCALGITWMVSQLINPELLEYYGAGVYSVSHAVGVDTCKLLVARSGVWGNNDLVWVGNAANVAAKMSAIRNLSGSSFISEAVYAGSHASVHESEGRSMWNRVWWEQGGIHLYSSTWWKVP